MTAPTESPNVVDLQKRQAAQPDARNLLGKLLRQVHNIAQNRLTGLVSTLFENVDDALFDLAEKAESNAVQTRFFDGMREVRKKRQLVERRFHEQVGRIFADFAAGALKPARPELTETATGDAGLALVDDQELEESLAVSSMVAKAEGRLSRPLYQVNQRLGVIVGGAKVENATNPIGPAVLCQGFRQTVREFDLAIQVKLIIYKLFDRYVIAGLGTLYDEVNSELIRAGVLPQIRHVAPQGAGARAPARARRSADAGGRPGDYEEDREVQPHADQPVGDYDPIADELQIGLYNTLRSLLAGRRGASTRAIADGDHYTGAATAADDVRHLSPTTLLNALSILQSQAQSRTDDAVETAQMVRRLKHELFEEVHKFGGDARTGHVSTADEDTIDLVGMLFEFILQDRNLPAQIQALLGRLQIPYLKIAIVDKHLFAQKGHPARRLLDALAEAGLGWSEEADSDHRLYDRIKQVVQAILGNFHEDLGIFERELIGFTGFMDQHHRRSQVAEQRAAEAIRGREKLHDARRTVAREILQCIDGHELPPVVRAVLARPWANYLVLTVLRHGLGSDEWKEALRFAREFVWSALPKTSEAERSRLRGLLPQFEKTLRHGLTTVAYHENDRVRLMRELSQLYQRLLGDEKITLQPEQDAATGAGQASGSAPTDANTPMAAGMALSAIDEAIEEIVLASGVSQTESPAAVQQEPDDEFLRNARELKVGTWLEFIDEAGNRDRAKLSWISPISAKYLFVNRRGLKICDKTVYALAAELRRGTSVILAEVPLFDRALDAIVERLRQGHAEGSPEPAPGRPTGG